MVLFDFPYMNGYQCLTLTHGVNQHNYEIQTLTVPSDLDLGRPHKVKHDIRLRVTCGLTQISKLWAAIYGRSNLLQFSLPLGPMLTKTNKLRYNSFFKISKIPKVVL